MKSLYESIFDVDDNITDVDKGIVDNFLKKYLTKESYKNCVIRPKNNDGKYEVSGMNVHYNDDAMSLTNDLFVWVEISGDFCCNGCRSLKSLKGCPKVSGWDFECCGCDSLTSLEGAPEEVKGYFDCSDCKSLKSLKGAPKLVRRNFYCEDNDGRFTVDDIKKVSKVRGAIYV